MIILKDEIWNSLFNPYDIICFNCIEIRLNRTITLNDLWVNKWGQVSQLNEWYLKLYPELSPSTNVYVDLHISK